MAHNFKRIFSIFIQINENNMFLYSRKNTNKIKMIKVLEANRLVLQVK